jgi:N-acetyl-gamma-glutamyl-phosphate reductase
MLKGAAVFFEFYLLFENAAGLYLATGIKKVTKILLKIYAVFRIIIKRKRGKRVFMYRIGIIGDGYTAAELLRLMAGHPQMEAVCVTSVDHIGEKVSRLYPQLGRFYDLDCEATELDQLSSRCDVVFLALPHGLSVAPVRALAGAGVRCVDLGADFRLKDAAAYETHYGLRHEAPELLNEAVYGLTELYRARVREAAVVANPGCYPTSAIVPLAPLLAAGLIQTDRVIIDAKSGVSGAGRSPRPDSHYCEVNEGVHAYALGRHRHEPEIRQELTLAAGKAVEVVFTPHLIPMNRGILTTAYARAVPGAGPDDIRAALAAAYREEYFIRLLPAGSFPHTKWVYGSNFIDIGVHVTPAGDVILVSALDNLTKGASGQAVQNFNVMAGLPEQTGLDFSGVMP